MEVQVLPKKKRVVQVGKYRGDFTNDKQFNALSVKYADEKSKELAVIDKIEEADLISALERYANDLTVDLYTIAESFHIHVNSLYRLLQKDRYKSFYEGIKRARGERAIQEGFVTACQPYDKIQNGIDVTMAEVASAKLKANYCLEYGRSRNSEFLPQKERGSEGGINVIVNTGIKLNV